MGSFADQSGIDPKRLKTLPMQPMNRYHLMFQMDIGLVPLNDIPFNRAKSFIKGLEYTASGIPFVAQGTGEYELLATDGVGRVATHRMGGQRRYVTCWITKLGSGTLLRRSAIWNKPTRLSSVSESGVSQSLM
jgi:hypothetical protein